MEICIVKAGNVTEMVEEDKIQAIVDDINQEKEAKEEERKGKSAAAKWDYHLTAVMRCFQVQLVTCNRRAPSITLNFHCKMKHNFTQE